MKKLLLKLIKLYQHTSTFRHQLLKTLWLSDASCRFQPTCSQYMYEAINKYGTIRGVLLGLKRILRCHPWSKGGPDPLI